MDAKQYLAALNPQQKQSAESPHKYTQILAGPGSGKTRVLAARVVHLLNVEQFHPNDIVIATFTNKAANEIKQRIGKLVKDNHANSLVSGTFHSIAFHYLLRHGKKVGLPKNWTVIDRTEATNIMKQLLERLRKAKNPTADGIRGQELTPNVALSRVSRMKSSGLIAKPHCEQLSCLPGLTVNTNQSFQSTELYKLYQAVLRKNGYVDFDDLLILFIQLVHDHTYCIDNIKHILVDEFQDTSKIQYLLIKLLARDTSGITIVGDPDQSIYGFRSAELGNLVMMTTDFPDTRVFHLETNYRSADSILETAMAIINQDKARPQKTLRTSHRLSIKPYFKEFDSNDQESAWVACEIKRMVKSCPGLFSYSDIAILVRSSSLTRAIEHALAEQGIAYKMVGVHKFFDREEVRDVVAYARVVAFRDEQALMRIINVPSRNIGKVKVERILQETERRHTSMWNTLCLLNNGSFSLSQRVDKQFQRELGKFMHVINTTEASCDSSAPFSISSMLEILLRKVKYYEYLKKKHPSTYEEKWENVMELIRQSDVLGEQGVLFDDEDDISENRLALHRFLANAAIVGSTDNNEETRHQVTISTLHAAKGLEWPVVFLPCLCDTILPHSRSTDVDEERRLLYVGITRAQAMLYMSSFRGMQSNFFSVSSSETTHMKRSRFLSDIVVDKTLTSADIVFSETLALEIGAILGRANSGPVQNIMPQALENGFRSAKVIGSKDILRFVTCKSLDEENTKNVSSDKPAQFDMAQWCGLKSVPKENKKSLTEQNKLRAITSRSHFNEQTRPNVTSISHSAISRQSMTLSYASSSKTSTAYKSPVPNLKRPATVDTHVAELNSLSTKPALAPTKKRLGMRLRRSKML
ncbi:ATP-dependent DNA helicase [Schizosaccharomyces japonicus yFS275]|uniref:DNA 3'-5' helicase n=1 Tax=Schizosaccharomyces japonicus (strain yFS275 / FY16936) TaxID=402676 RepID=B6K032_SCHJY|nr:ATP-dependent DNA helicase [Schizosaccharomyces japonicus yFS275]EEB06182.2 ATP-dependent DNA helicase [Schizosaccharomyces japonicus yFS275]